MIYVKECQRHNRNTSGMLKKTAEIELSKHNGAECICSSEFTRFIESRKLGVAPIKTQELKQLIMAL